MSAPPLNHTKLKRNEQSSFQECLQLVDIPVNEGAHIEKSKSKVNTIQVQSKASHSQPHRSVNTKKQEMHAFKCTSPH